MQLNNVLNKNSVSYRDKFSVTSNFKNSVNFDNYVQSSSSTASANVDEVVDISTSTIKTPTSNAIISTTVEPSTFGDIYTDNSYYENINGNLVYVSSSHYDFNFLTNGQSNYLGDYTFPNNTAFGFQYTLDSTKERPLAEAITVDEQGNCIRQIIDINAVDPNNCTTTEFCAVYLHLLKENVPTDDFDGIHRIFDLENILCNEKGSHQFDSYPKYDDKKNFLNNAQAYADFNSSLPFLENKIQGDKLSNLLSFFENIKNEIADTFIENDSLFDTQLEELDKQIQNQYEYSKLLKL